MLASVKRALYSEKKMESVQERMERIGAYAKIASFMQKEKQASEEWLRHSKAHNSDLLLRAKHAKQMRCALADSR